MNLQYSFEKALAVKQTANARRIFMCKTMELIRFMKILLLLIEVQLRNK